MDVKIIHFGIAEVKSQSTAIKFYTSATHFNL